MSYNTLRSFCTGLAIMMMLTPVNAHAAKAYTYKVIDNSTVFSDKRTINVDNYYKYIVLKGNSAAIKKYNKTAKKKAEKIMSGKKDIMEFAKAASKEKNFGDETYSDCGGQVVSYISKDLISVRNDWYWYAGGVSNTSEYGTTYDLKNGRFIKLMDVTKVKSAKKIKNILKKKIESANQGYDTSELDKMDISKLEFYINKKGNVVVCFGPYELGFGGWTKKFTLEGNLK